MQLVDFSVAFKSSLVGRHGKTEYLRYNAPLMSYNSGAPESSSDN